MLHWAILEQPHCFFASLRVGGGGIEADTPGEAISRSEALPIGRLLGIARK